VAANTIDGRGINLHFRPDDQTQGGAIPGPGNQHFNFLNDQIAWGPVINFGSQVSFQQGQFYWLRLLINPDAPPGTNNLANGANDVFAKIWLADGVEPEPLFMTAWNQNGRSGLAGLVANSIGGAATFDVDYVLIKAAGLPQITATTDVPEPASLGLLALGAAALSRRRRR
jgi:hypothetical protein